MCLALGHGSIAQTMELSAAEFDFWRRFYLQNGFPVDRLEAATALAGAYVCRATNPASKVEPKDLIPKWGRRSRSALIAAFAGIPGAKVERKTKGQTSGSE